MTTELGTELGTILGTILSSMDVEGAPTFDLTKVYALDGLSTANYFVVQTPATGGELGVVGGGFGVVMLVANAPLAARRASSAGWNGGSGWTIDMVTAGWRTSCGMTNGSNVSADVPSGAPGQLDVVITEPGTVNLAMFSLRGAGQKTTALAAPYRPGTAPATDPHTLGSAANGGFANGRILAELTYAGTPSVAQKQALCDAIRVLGDIPSKAAVEALMPGCTVRKRWSLRDVLSTPNLPIADGAAAPASIPDSVGGAAADAMVKVGSPVVRVLDPGAYPRTSYGAMGFSTTSTLQSAAGAGFRGSAAGFTVRVVVTFWSIAAGIEYFADCANQNGATGWVFSRNAATLGFGIGNGTAASASKTLTSADLGVPHLLHLVFSGTAVEGFFDGVSVGSAAGAFAPALSSVPLVIGGLSTSVTYGASNETAFALAGANHVATAAEVAADFAAWQRTGTLANITSGKPDANRYDLTADVLANGGPSAGVPATVQDRVGTDHLTRVGTGLQVSQRTERLWSYETTPIMYGAGSLSSSSYFASAVNALPGADAGFVVSLFFVVTSQASTGVKSVFNQTETSSNSGWEMWLNGTNATIGFGAGNGTSNINAPPGSIAASDVGKLLLATAVFDRVGGKARMYFKRAEVGAGTSLSGTYTPRATMPAAIGRRANGSNGSDGCVVLGAYYALGIPTLAQVQSQFDTVMAIERMAICPGLPGTLIDLTQDAAGGSLPSTLTDRSTGGVNFTLAGSPTLAAQYARAFSW